MITDTFSLFLLPLAGWLRNEKMRSKCWLSILLPFYIYSHTCLTIVGFFSNTVQQFQGNAAESWLWSLDFLHCIKNLIWTSGKTEKIPRGLAGWLADRATTVQNCKLSDPLPALSQTVQTLSSNGCTHRLTHTSTLCVVKTWRECGQAVWRNNWQHRRKRERETRKEEHPSKKETSPGGKCC